MSATGTTPTSGSPQTAPTDSPAARSAVPDAASSLRGYTRELRRRVRGGELGSLPVAVGLLAIWIIFQTMNSRFLSAQNLSNLSIDIVPTGLMSVGIVFVLLLGEIDLSIGSVSGVSAAVMAVLQINHGWNPAAAILAAIATGTLLGTVHGVFFAKVGVPAFVVTLAGLLAWNGLQLQILGPNGTVNLPTNGFISQLTGTYFTQQIAAYALALAATALFAAAYWPGSRRRRAAGIPARGAAEITVRTTALAVVSFAAAYLLNQYKGLPLALVIFLAVVVGSDLLLRRVGYGRTVFAVGGNAEAARRAGINIAAVRISVFAICGAMAALGGIFAASRISSASQATGQSNVLMMAIAAAVIGGTSLFGGRGSTWSALLGMLVIQSIASGMALQGVSNSIQFMVTGAVLLAAVVLDSLTRRSRKTAGRA